MTYLTVITPPAEAPLSLVAAKAFLRIGGDGEDALVADLLQSARLRLQQVAGLALVTQTVRVTWPAWPLRIRGRGVRFPIRPVQQLVSVRAVDVDGVDRPYTDRFQLLCERVCMRPGSALPLIPVGGRVEIDVEAGFGAAAAVPEDLREALLRLMAAMYATRTPGAFEFASKGGLPADVQAILDARKEVRL